MACQPLIGEPVGVVQVPERVSLCVEYGTLNRQDHVLEGVPGGTIHSGNRGSFFSDWQPSGNYQP